MKLIVPICLLAVLFVPSLHVTAQASSSNTLLWRIEGNGLSAPSYLYGTMHLKDRRLFFFGDSVYKSLEASSGFAMELDPNEMMDSMFSKMAEADTTTLLRKLLDEKKFKMVSKKLEKKFGMPAGQITRKQLIDERESWYYKIHKPDDMKSVVDLYLYDIAHKQGKWVGGIEDVNDQLGIKDELGKDINIASYIDDDNDDQRKVYIEKMISVYAAEDIGKIDAMTSGESQKTRDLLLITRNIKMAGRMDTMAHTRNSFFAVGAAHLPGETGLIRLLQKKGFTVTPVISSKKIAPEKYTYTVKEIPWIKFYGEDSAYTAETPGKPSDLPVQEIVKLKVYADVVTNTFYMTGYSFIGTDETMEASMDRMIGSFANKGFEKKDAKKIINKGIEGKELFAEKENVFFRIQVFTINNKVFLVMAGAEKKTVVYSPAVEKFLSSFTMNTTLAPKPVNWVDHQDSAKAFSISFPKKASIDKLKPGENETNYETITYTAMDLPASTYYMVVVSDTKKGFVIEEDSLVFEAKLNYYKEIKSPATDIRKFQLDGNAAISFSAHVKNEGTDVVAKILTVSRGNRSYYVAAVTPKGKEDYLDITRFFRSFKLLPYKEAEWSKQVSADHRFSTWAPSGLESVKPDTVGLSGDALREKLEESEKEIQLLSHDPYSPTTYNVTIYPVAKYYWAASDSAFIADQLSTYFSPADGYYAKEHPGSFDSIVHVKPVTNGTVKGYEILVKNAAKNYWKKVRVLPHGDSAYHLFALAPYGYLTNPNNNKFFDDFRFEQEGVPSSILQNKTGVILADLAGTDSASKSAAWQAMSNAKFTTADLPLLHKAYLKQYPADDNFYSTINERISQSIEAVHDSSTVSFVTSNYTTAHPELKMELLEMLASQQTSAAIVQLKELLLKDPPLKGSPNSLVYQLTDSLLLATHLFPEASSFFGDSILGAGMLALADEAIDSNLLSKEILSANMTAIFRTADATISSIKKDKDYYQVYIENLINVLEKINNPRSVGLLNGFLKSSDQDIKQHTLLALLKIKQPVSPLEVRKLASDKVYRNDFYQALKKIDKQQLFTPEFLTQQLFAESYLYNYAMEEEDDDAENISCKLLSEKVAIVGGIQRRFYLFKVGYAYDGETTTHLAVCGPFDINRKQVETVADNINSRIFYETKFDPATVNKLFKQYMTDSAAEKPAATR